MVTLTSNGEDGEEPPAVRFYSDAEYPRPADVPVEFWWQSKPHHVINVVSHRRVSEEVWRVSAVARSASVPGVFDLCFDWSDGRWSITRVRMFPGEANIGGDSATGKDSAQ